MNSITSIFRRGDLIAVFAFAAILRLAYFAISNDQAGIDKIMEQCFDCRLYYNMSTTVFTGSDAFEHGFFYFGPGYAWFLALNRIFFGNALILYILFNILLSSFSTLLVYKLARVLTGNKAIAIIAALLAATSLTSINLSLHLLSDTFFFFIFLIDILLLLKALETGRWKYFLLCGALTAFTVLTRSIAQFWPIMMLLIGIPFIVTFDFKARKISSTDWRLLRQLLTAAAIVVLVTFSWMYRNHRVHGVYALAITGANGPANVAAVTLERWGNGSSQDIMRGWVQEYKEAHHLDMVPLGEIYKVYQRKAWEGARTMGRGMIKTYLLLTWENLNEVTRMHRYLFPEHKWDLATIDEWVMNHKLNYTAFILLMLGFVILLATRRYRTAFILACIYFYFAGMIGCFRWQYTRFFFPGQIAWSVLLAVVFYQSHKTLARALASLYDFFRHLVLRLRHAV